DPGEKVGPIAKLQALWKALPAPDKAHPDPAREGCAAMREYVTGLREKVAWKFNNLNLPSGFSTGGQAFIMWKNRQYATHRRLLDPNTLQVGGVPTKPRVMTARRRRNGMPEMAEPPAESKPDPELFVP